MMTTTEQRYREHYSAIRKRLMTPPRKPKPVAKKIVPTVAIHGMFGSYDFSIGFNFNGNQSRLGTIERVLDAVSQFYGISKVDLLSARRTKGIVMPRQIAMFLARELTTRSLPDIGRRIGNRDHTTVLHACRKIDALLSWDETLKVDVNAIRVAINTTSNNIGILP